MYQVFSSLLDHLHFLFFFYFTFMEQFFIGHPININAEKKTVSRNNLDLLKERNRLTYM